MFKQENPNDERRKEGENPNIDDKKISMLKKENPNEEGEIEMQGGEDERAVDWLKPNWGTRHARGNLIRHHIIHLLAAPPTNEDTDDDEGRHGQYGLIIDQDNQGLSSKSFLNWSL